MEYTLVLLLLFAPGGGGGLLGSYYTRQPHGAPGGFETVRHGNPRELRARP